MALDDPVVFILIALIVLIFALVVYAVYKLAKFLLKVSRFIDDQGRSKSRIPQEKVDEQI